MCKDLTVGLVEFRKASAGHLSKSRNEFECSCRTEVCENNEQTGHKNTEFC